MAVSASIEPFWLRLEAEGLYTKDEVIGAFDGALPNVDARIAVLVDARRSRVNPPYHELQATAAYGDSIAHRIGPKVALVVDGLLRYGLARILVAFGSIGGKLEYCAFYDLEQAERWLLDRPAASRSGVDHAP